MISKERLGLSVVALMLSVSVAAAADFKLRDVKDIALGQSLEAATQAAINQGFVQHRTKPVKVGQRDFQVDAFYERSFSKQDTKERIELRAAAEQFGSGITFVEYLREFDEPRADANKLHSQIIENAGTEPTCENNQNGLGWTVDRDHNYHRKASLSSKRCISYLAGYSIPEMTRHVAFDKLKEDDEFIGFWARIEDIRFGEKATAGRLRVSYRSFADEIDVVSDALSVSRALASQEKTVDKVDF
ncbi:hypothetical protein ACGYLI_17105 [Sulfitobacter sp. 1A13421]